MNKGKEPMKGWRTALVSGALLISGCGSQPAAVPEAAKAPPAAGATTPAEKQPAALRRAGVRTGTYRTAASRPAPAPAPAPVRVNPEPAAEPSARAGVRSFRRAQLAGLRAHCATAPPDPRCDGTRVNRAVAFSGLEPTR